MHAIVMKVDEQGERFGSQTTPAVRNAACSCGERTRVPVVYFFRPKKRENYMGVAHDTARKRTRGFRKCVFCHREMMMIMCAPSTRRYMRQPRTTTTEKKAIVELIQVFFVFHLVGKLLEAVVGAS